MSLGKLWLALGVVLVAIPGASARTVGFAEAKALSQCVADLGLLALENDHRQWALRTRREIVGLASGIRSETSPDGARALMFYLTGAVDTVMADRPPVGSSLRQAVDTRVPLIVAFVTGRPTDSRKQEPCPISD